jgi:hypothetical protein
VGPTKKTILGVNVGLKKHTISSSFQQPEIFNISPCIKRSWLGTGTITVSTVLNKPVALVSINMEARGTKFRVKMY